MAFVIDDIAIALAAAALGTSVIGTTQAASRQRDAERAQKRMEARKFQRQQQEQYREQQRETARISAMSAAQGTLDSSGFEGQQGMVKSSSAGNIAFANQMFEGQNMINNTLASAARRQQNFGIAASVFQLGSMAASNGMFDTQYGSATSANQAVSAGNRTSSLDANYLASGGRVA